MSSKELKKDAVVENYQGKFAKVIEVKQSITHLSAWVASEALAKKEIVSVRGLNAFGLSQVLKGGDNVSGEEAPKKKEAPKKDAK